MRNNAAGTNRCLELLGQWTRYLANFSTSGGWGDVVVGLLLTLTPNLKEIDIPIYSCLWGWTTAYSPLSGLYHLSELSDSGAADDEEESKFMTEVAFLWPMMRGIWSVKCLSTAGTNASILNLPFQSLRNLKFQLAQV
jgi:hypothetical protein